jgi:uncharacterized protein (DUF1015 family)
VAQIRPFAGIRYSRTKGFDLSNLIAPPYDVLDEAGKAALQHKHPNNIVTVDLPHLPAKTVGPDDAYARAAVTLKSWLSAGILERDSKPAIHAYAQTYAHGGRNFHRRGLIALVKLSPFGEGHVFPHEKTYPDAIQDRLKLTQATGVQLSPIFGLFSDPRSQVTTALFKGQSKPQVTATLDGVQNDLWSITDATTLNTIIDLLAARAIYIADGHHRYTMALQYQKDMIENNGGRLPPNHPANFCMFVLVAMQDDGLLILPTHRLIGGLSGFDIAAFKSAIFPKARCRTTSIMICRAKRRILSACSTDDSARRINLPFATRTSWPNGSPSNRPRGETWMSRFCSAICWTRCSSPNSPPARIPSVPTPPTATPSPA